MAVPVKACPTYRGVPLNEVPLIEVVSHIKNIGRFAGAEKSVLAPLIEVSHLAKSHLNRGSTVLQLLVFLYLDWLWIVSVEANVHQYIGEEFGNGVRTSLDHRPQGQNPRMPLQRIFLSRLGQIRLLKKQTIFLNKNVKKNHIFIRKMECT